MDISFLDNILNNANEFGKWLFESYAGITVLIVATLLLTFLIAVILEVRTKSKFKNHPIEENEQNEDEE